MRLIKIVFFISFVSLDSRLPPLAGQSLFILAQEKGRNKGKGEKGEIKNKSSKPRTML